MSLFQWVCRKEPTSGIARAARTFPAPEIPQNPKTPAQSGQMPSQKSADHIPSSHFTPLALTPPSSALHAPAPRTWPHPSFGAIDLR